MITLWYNNTGWSLWLQQNSEYCQLQMSYSPCIHKAFYHNKPSLDLHLHFAGKKWIQKQNPLEFCKMNQKFKKACCYRIWTFHKFYLSMTHTRNQKVFLRDSYITLSTLYLTDTHKANWYPHPHWILFSDNA